jgi:peptidoglycan hydrolase-like protein with peptidoglycan-binding domain
VDGGWGEKTKGAVKMAQEKLGLPVTGVVDDATLAALNEQTEIRMFEYRQKLEQKSASQRLQ